MKRPIYAAETDVPVKRSRDAIEEMLTKYGATSFAYGSQDKRSIIMFEFSGRRVRFDLPLPVERSIEKTEKAHRSRWRALFLSIKAKLVSVDCGIETFEEAFLAHVVLADGSKVSDAVTPAIAEQYKTGKVGPLLLEGPRT